MKRLTTKCLGFSGTSLSPEPDMCTFSSAARTNHQSRPFLMARQSGSPQLPVTLNSGSQRAASLQQTCQSHLLCYFLTSELKGVDPSLQPAKRKGVGGSAASECKTDSFLFKPWRQTCVGSMPLALKKKQKLSFY